MLLAGDIGGTKTRLAVFSAENGPMDPLREATFTSAHYPSLESIVRQFLDDVSLPVQRATFGVAGPVMGGQVTTTNLPWKIDAQALQSALDLASVRLLNDLAAIAHAVPRLRSDDLWQLNRGKRVPDGTIGVIAPGTGLGEAFLAWDGRQYRTHASEGGHVDFGPRNDLQSELLRFYRQRFDHVSYERVCSGLGIPNLFAFLIESGHAEKPAWLADRLAKASDPTPILVGAALDPDQPCPACVETLNLFVSILGAEAGNLALKTMATGGIFLGGGIPPRILGSLQEPRFMEAFTRKGRFSELLADIPIHVILNPKSALLGAACYGFEEL
jgi:glucokinase